MLQCNVNLQLWFVSKCSLPKCHQSTWRRKAGKSWLWTKRSRMRSHALNPFIWFLCTSLNHPISRARLRLPNNTFFNLTVDFGRFHTILVYRTIPSTFSRLHYIVLSSLYYHCPLLPLQFDVLVQQQLWSEDGKDSFCFHWPSLELQLPQKARMFSGLGFGGLFGAVYINHPLTVSKEVP